MWRQIQHFHSNRLRSKAVENRTLLTCEERSLRFLEPLGLEDGVFDILS